jgi:uncharacterized protein
MHPSATIAKNRILTVDALRGFALLGIMIVHFLFWYTAGPLPEAVYSKYNDIGSTIARIFSEIFLSGKFFAFFSFLFGLSFYLQTGERRDGRNGVVGRFAWRITLLLLIGLVHHAFWQGDILSIYAPLGFLLLAARPLSNRWVLILGVLLAINFPGKIMTAVQMLSAAPPSGGFGDFAAMGKEYDKVITTGTLPEVLRFNLLHLKSKFDFQIGSGRLFVTMGFFLLGMYVGRQRWFEQGEDVRAVWRKICKRSAAIAGVCMAIGLSIFAANEIGKLGWEQNPGIGFFFSFLFDGFSACLVAFYVSGLTLLMFRLRWRRFFFSMVPVGKMALTSYLTQTMFGLLLFWGFGAGLYTKTSLGFNFLIAILFFYVQVVISRYWLQSFYYGPVEWLWRSATLLKVQKFKRKKSKPEVAPATVVTTLVDTPKTEIPTL